MDQIHLSAGTEIAADCAWRGFQTAGGAQHFADDADRFESFDDRGDNWPASNEAFERWIPALLHVLGIVLFSQRRCDTHHLHSDDIQPFVFETAEDAAGEAALNAVRFEQDERALHVEISPIVDSW